MENEGKYLIKFMPSFYNLKFTFKQQVGAQTRNILARTNQLRRRQKIYYIFRQMRDNKVDELERKNYLLINK